MAKGMAIGVVRVAGLVLVALLAGCVTGPPEISSVSALRACPASPNCVNSNSGDVEPLVAASDLGLAWLGLIKYLGNQQNLTIIVQEDGYLRAEARSSLFGFVDDVEFLLQPDRNQIAVRSASRVGYSDLGVNRRRVERLRAALAAEGLIKSDGS